MTPDIPDLALVSARLFDPLGSEQQMAWAEAPSRVRLEDCGPVRPFPVRSGRRIAPGWWWSATNGQLVRYGSGVMRTQVMLLDHDPDVVAMAGRPVELLWHEPGGLRVQHAPHLMARLADGSGLLLDCAGREEISRRLAHRAEVVAAAAASVGWRYKIVRPQDPVLAANLGWLAGYRHPRCGVAIWRSAWSMPFFDHGL